VFDELGECDERQYIHAVKSRWEIRSVEVPSDDAWPLHHWESWPHNPNYPNGNAYRLVRERAYQRAAEQGVRVLLTGDFGDHLYSGEADWLGDLLLERRFRDALEDVFSHLWKHGLSRTLQAGFMRRLARRVLASFPNGRRLFRKSLPRPWLTTLAASRIPPEDTHPDSERHRALLGNLTAVGSSMEAYHASRHGIELRTPYRDRRLVEFMLSVPAHQLYRSGVHRPILRNAMRGILPELVRLRVGKTSWESLYERGFTREAESWHTNLKSSLAPWRGFVRPEWLLTRWDRSFHRELDGIDKIIPWLCLSFDAWFNRQFSGMAACRCVPVHHVRSACAGHAQAQVCEG
jgi:asparagine synthase (glutamine-hydrolysing)